MHMNAEVKSYKSQEHAKTNEPKQSQGAKRPKATKARLEKKHPKSQIQLPSHFMKPLRKATYVG